jgi:enamine deaminase RidA (YjgF/YER057c/UK114 family)
MSHTTSNPDGLHNPVPFGYSHITVVDAPARLAFVAGQYASGSDGMVVADDFGAQVEQAFGNLAVAVSAAGGTMADVVQLRTYVVDVSMDKLGMIGAAVGRLWGDTPPVHTVLGVAGLAMPSILFEVEAVAAI